MASAPPPASPPPLDLFYPSFRSALKSQARIQDGTACFSCVAARGRAPARTHAMIPSALSLLAVSWPPNEPHSSSDSVSIRTATQTAFRQRSRAGSVDHSVKKTTGC
jgi:hypothetical protein